MNIVVSSLCQTMNIRRSNSLKERQISLCLIIISTVTIPERAMATKKKLTINVDRGTSLNQKRKEVKHFTTKMFTVLDWSCYAMFGKSLMMYIYFLEGFRRSPIPYWISHFSSSNFLIKEYVTSQGCIKSLKLLMIWWRLLYASSDESSKCTFSVNINDIELKMSNVIQKKEGIFDLMYAVHMFLLNLYQLKAMLMPPPSPQFQRW